MAVESSHAVNPNVYLKTAYDPVRDFAPVSNLADVPNVLVVNPACSRPRTCSRSSGC